MKTFSNFMCLILAVTMLFGVISTGCSADFRPITIKDPETVSVSGTETTSDPEVHVDPEIPEESEKPVEPESPVEPEKPSDPEVPSDPEKPADPEAPAEPFDAPDEPEVQVYDGDPHETEKPSEPDESVITLETNEPDTFKSKEELIDFVKENYKDYFNNHVRYYATDDANLNYDGAWIEEEPMAEMPTAVPSESYNGTGENKGEVSGTNLVDENVDEGDILKTDGNYIYIIRDNELIIVTAKGKDTSVLSYYKVIAQGEGNITEMYIKGDKAIIIATVSIYYDPAFKEETEFGKPVDISGDDRVEINDYYYYYPRYKTYSAVYVIDITDREKPKEVSCDMIEGYLLSSREMDGKIYIVANKDFGYYYRYYDEILPEVYSTDDGFRMVDATSIIRPIFDNISYSIMTLATVDYINGKETETISILGSGSDIYMTPESLYVFGHTYYSGEITSVAKYAIGDSLSYVASVSVPGYTATDFSYNEYKGRFRIATTTYSNEGTVNNVYVYDSNLKKIGELTGLAPKEKIYSVRFTGDVAYIVTFRQVDPLFVIDMSGNDPKVMGELKVPGFSTYLHPVGEGLLLGIGKETRDDEYTDYYGNKYTSTYTVGMKISLFDVSDQFNPREIDVVNMVGDEYASADVLNNYKAFVYSSVRNTGYFAIDTMSGCGIACVSVKDGKLECNVVIPRRNDPKWYDSYSSRPCFIEDTLYFYQYNRIYVYDRDSLEETAVVTIK